MTVKFKNLKKQVDLMENKNDGATVTIKIPKLNLWMVSTLVLVVLLAVTLFSGFSITGKSVAVLPADDVGKKAINYLNSNIVQPGTTATYVSTKDIGSVYEISFLYQGKNNSVYSTKDGKMIFLYSFDTSETLPTQTQTTTQAAQKTAKPTVQLFVMAFCPYGIQAETAMKPVVDLLGGKADIQIHFIASVGGNTPDTVQSLHGAVEAQEDLRQVCIIKNYDQKTFWNYVTQINTNCASKYNDPSYESCWKEAAGKAGIDVSKIDTCSKGSEGVGLLKADAGLSSSKGVSGSPTLIINGATYNGGRTPDAYKQGICSAFTTAPAECSTALSSTGAAATGGC